jgi:hypothetical protein
MTRAARAFFGITALVVLTGLVVQLIAAWQNTTGHFTSPWARLLNVFCFFTIDSNVIVGATTALLALRPGMNGQVARVFRLAGVIGITITGIVYHAVLSGLFELDGLAKAADQILHTYVPVLAVLGWLVFGPRGRIDPRTIAYAALFPLAWLVFTLIRGAVIDFYPYPFVDVTAHGYPRVLVNCVLVAVLFVVIAGGALLLDRALPRTQDRLR